MYETTGARMKNWNRGTALERIVVKRNTWGLWSEFHIPLKAIVIPFRTEPFTDWHGLQKKKQENTKLTCTLPSVFKPLRIYIVFVSVERRDILNVLQLLSLHCQETDKSKKKKATTSSVWWTLPSCSLMQIKVSVINQYRNGKQCRSWKMARPSYLDLHCLHRYYFWSARLEGLNK